MAETFSNLNPIIIAIMGGIVPSLIWLWFWLREDAQSPEPTGLIALSFFAGMAIVYFVLPVQKIVISNADIIMSTIGTFFTKFSHATNSLQVVEITLLAFIEEIAKFATVFLIVFKTKYFDEPIDAVIYLITAALGFAAMENTLYIFKDIGHGGGAQVFLDGNLRFVGATLVHTISSSIVGIAIAFSFYAPRFIKIIAIISGIIIATLLHAYFNLSIMEINGTLNTLFVFSQFWAGIVAVIILLQIVKRLKVN